ncbi:MAG: hypothetical protein AAGF72_12650, partial [Pseudomonadota bacterium]
MGLDADSVLFVNVGRISPQKGLIELVRAFSQSNLPTTFHLALVGPSSVTYSDYEQSLKAEIESSSKKS